MIFNQPEYIHPQRIVWDRIKTTNENPEQDEETLDEVVSEDEQTSVAVFDKFANIQLNGPVCAETVNPIVDFIIGANLSSNEEMNLNVINLFIDTEGGDLHSAMKLIDAIRMSEIPVRTIGWGKVASAGLIIFMTGQERFLSENCSILSHNATFNAASYSVRVTDFSHQQEFKLINDRIMRVYKECTGKDEKYIKKHLLRDNDVYMSAADAIEHGLCDGFLPRGMSWLKCLVKQTKIVEEALDTKLNT